MVIASIIEAATNIQDEGVRERLISGVDRALEAVHMRAGDHIRVSEKPIEHV